MSCWTKCVKYCEREEEGNINISSITCANFEDKIKQRSCIPAGESDFQDSLASFLTITMISCLDNHDKFVPIIQLVACTKSALSDEHAE